MSSRNIALSKIKQAIRYYQNAIGNRKYLNSPEGLTVGFISGNNYINLTCLVDGYNGPEEDRIIRYTNRPMTAYYEISIYSDSNPYALAIEICDNLDNQFTE